MKDYTHISKTFENVRKVNIFFLKNAKCDLSALTLPSTPNILRKTSVNK